MEWSAAARLAAGTREGFGLWWDTDNWSNVAAFMRQYEIYRWWADVEEWPNTPANAGYPNEVILRPDATIDVLEHIINAYDEIPEFTYCPVWGDDPGTVGFYFKHFRDAIHFKLLMAGFL